MRRLHGPDWRERGGAHRGRRRAHLATAGAGAAALTLGLAGRRPLAALTGARWLVATAQFAWLRTAPGPRDRREVATMAVAGAAMPFAASAWWLRGVARAGGLAAAGRPARRSRPPPSSSTATTR